MKNLYALVLFCTLFLIVFSLSVSAREITCCDNPTQLWHFSEGNGTNAEDNCHGVNATLYGGMTWVDGRYGNATNFDGINSYLDAGNIFPFNESMSEFSFSLWVNFSNNLGYQSVFRSGYYNPYTEFMELLQVSDGLSDYITFMGANSLGIQSIDDSEWHHIVGTFNGTSQISKLYIDGNLTNEYNTTISEITPTETPLYFGFNFDNDFLMNGSLDEVAFFNRTLTQEEVIDFYTDFNCSNQNVSIMTLYVSNYPYVDLNTSYQIAVSFLTNNISNPSKDIDIKLQNSSGSIFIFNLNWDNATQLYKTNLTFLEKGYYSFTIFPCINPCKTANITGTLRVFEPYYITFRIFEIRHNATTPYENDLGYILAEFSSNNQFGYDNNLENFVSPLLFSYTFNKSVFHAPYINGEAILKLWEADKYAVRFVDGDISFDNEYSKPIVNKLYGTNFFIDEYTFNGTSKTINVYMEGKDIHPYTWLFNVILIILIVLCLISAVAIFFVVPQYPTISITMGLVFPIILIIIRIILYILVA